MSPSNLPVVAKFSILTLMIRKNNFDCVSLISLSNLRCSFVSEFVFLSVHDIMCIFLNKYITINFYDGRTILVDDFHVLYLHLFHRTTLPGTPQELQLPMGWLLLWTYWQFYLRGQVSINVGLHGSTRGVYMGLHGSLWVVTRMVIFICQVEYQ